jgi:ComF family protein
MACRQVIPVNERRRVRIRLCVQCEGVVEPLTPPLCIRCGKPVKTKAVQCGDCKARAVYFSRNIAAFPYDEVMREIMLDIKFRSQKCAAVGLGHYWAEKADEKDFAGFDIIAPLPLFKEKERERGFNQAELLAAPLAEKFNVFFEKELLIRTKDTVPQSELSPLSRAENVTGAFLVNPSCSVKHKKIILIDDIYTTGASLNECAKILKQEGAEEIKCMTLSITLKKNKLLDDI